MQGVRLGTYGDPCAVNNEVWQALTSKALYSTAYTHAAINPMPESIMTSTDNLKQSVDAWGRRMKEHSESYLMLINYINAARFLCPASEEMGKRATCASCKLCGGSKVNAKSIAIVAHGTSKRKAKEVVQ